MLQRHTEEGGENVNHIKMIPTFPPKTLFTYLYRTSVEDYFRFLEQKVSGCTPEVYRIFRERMCSSLGVHKTESLLDLMHEMYHKICEVRDELIRLYDDKYAYDDMEYFDGLELNAEKRDIVKRLKKKVKERDDLYRYLYILFIQPLLRGLGDVRVWNEQMRQRICSCRLHDREQ